VIGRGAGLCTKNTPTLTQPTTFHGSVQTSDSTTQKHQHHGIERVWKDEQDVRASFESPSEFFSQNGRMVYFLSALLDVSVGFLVRSSQSLFRVKIWQFHL
jgi:hypothetical protein